MVNPFQDGYGGNPLGKQLDLSHAKTLCRLLDTFCLHFYRLFLGCWPSVLIKVVQAFGFAGARLPT